MNSNRAVQATKKTVTTFSVLTVLFILIFGGLTLFAFFLSRLNF